MPRSKHADYASIIVAGLVVAIGPLAVAQPASQASTYRGACDGSAGVALDQDHFAVADDDRNVLRIYRTGQPNPDPSSPNLDSFLEAPPKKKGGFKEADIEGAARIGDRIYWLGSHGRDSEGDEEPGRARFFATRVAPSQDGPRLEVVGSGAYKGLREDLFADPKLADLKLADAYAPGKKNGPEPESDNGFNIEGLAATADGYLLVGFRNPRPKSQSIIIPIENPADVVEKGSKPVFGKPILLDLEGRGIRSIERIADRYVIVAGPHGEAKESKIKPPFALFTWSATENDGKPIEVKDLTMPGDFAPEALFASQDGSTLTLLSDDGDLNNCKKADESQKTFKALRFSTPK